MFCIHHQQHDIHCYIGNTNDYEQLLHYFHYSSLIHWLEREDRNKMFLYIIIIYVLYVRYSDLFTYTYIIYIYIYLDDRTAPASQVGALPVQ